MSTSTLPAERMPSRMRKLPRDRAGRPVPFFVEWSDRSSEPDFRIMDPAHLRLAITGQLCWVCGQRLNRVLGSSSPKGTFVAGPMCLVNRTSAEPPCHADCAEWSAKACPFLSNPAKLRREGHYDGTPKELPGIAIMRNPGVTGLIDSQRWDLFNPPGGGVLFRMQRIVSVRWFARGAAAAFDDVMTSIETGLPALVEMAESEAGGMQALGRSLRDALAWVPGAPDDYALVRRVLEAQP